VEQVRGVDVLEAAQGLVDKVLDMCVGERLAGADLWTASAGGGRGRGDGDVRRRADRPPQATPGEG
jgi:hypothetical protein